MRRLASALDLAMTFLRVVKERIVAAASDRSVTIRMSWGPGQNADSQARKNRWESQVNAFSNQYWA